MSLPVIPLLHLGLQGLALSACGWLLLRLFARDARHRAWTAAFSLLACAMLPILLRLLPAIGMSPSDPPETLLATPPTAGAWRIRLTEAPLFGPVASVSPTPLRPSIEVPWPQLLAGIWVTGSSLLLLSGSLRLRRSLRWRRSLRHPSTSEIQSLPRDLTHTDLLVSDHPISPCLAGLLRPVIVVPATALTQWSPDRWQWTLAHEAEHQRGGDHLLAPLITLAKILWWWNPFVRSLAAHWSLAREEVCDAAALSPARPETDPSAYASFLLELAAAPAPAALSMAASHPARRLKRRITALLEQHPVANRLHPAFPLLAFFTLTLASLGVNSLGVEAAPIPKTASQSGELVTRVFTLQPHFDGAKDAKAWLSQVGVAFPEGSSAVFNRSTSQLIVRHSPEALKQISERLTKWQAEFDNNNPKQVYLSSKWVELPVRDENQIPLIGNLNTVGPVLTDPQFQVVLRALSQVKGADLLVAPSVTTKSGQRATVEVLREVFVSPEGKKDFAGVRSDFTATIKEDGYQIEVSISADMGVAFQGGKRLKDWKTMTSSPMKILHLYATQTATLNDGETLLIPSGDSEPGRKVMLFVTASLIQPAGQKITPDQLRALTTTAANAPPHQPESAPPQKPVRIRAKILEEKGTVALKAFLPAQNPDVTPDQPGALDANIATSPLPPGTLSLSGVMSSDQFTALIKTLQQDTRVQMTDAPVERVITGAATLTRITADQVVQVTPTIGADGQTIDLNLHLLIEDKSITTSVSIWPGQTVILSGIMSVDNAGNPTLSRAICITAEIEKADETQ